MNIGALQTIQAERLLVAKDKNHDYSQTVDNIAVAGKIGLAVRIMDKACRILSLAHLELKGQSSKVSNESFRDSALDLGNYADFLVSVIDGTWNED